MGITHEDGTLDFNALIKEAHATAVEKGWWEKERDENEVFALFHTEVSEAFEEYRKGKPLEEIYFSWDEDEFGGRFCNCGTVHEEDDCPTCGSEGKPEGFTVELADLLIRVADWMGHEGLEYDPCGLSPAENVAEFTMLLHNSICVTWESDGRSWHIIGTVLAFAAENHLPLIRALEMKLAYNKTRPYRHGGKKA